MKISKKGLANLVADEAICLTSYLDNANVKTIFIGFTKYVIKDLESWDWNKEIELKEGFKIFKKAVKEREDIVNKYVTVDISQEMFDALVSLVYNIGERHFRESSVLRVINNGGSVRNIKRAWSMWRIADGRVSAGLVARRKRELETALNGIYHNEEFVGRIVEVHPNSHKPINSKSKNIDIEKYL